MIKCSLKSRWNFSFKPKNNIQNSFSGFTYVYNQFRAQYVSIIGKFSRRSFERRGWVENLSKLIVSSFKDIMVLYRLLSSWLPCNLEVSSSANVSPAPIIEGGLNLINSLDIPLGRACPAYQLSVIRQTNLNLDLAFPFVLFLEVWTWTMLTKIL